MKSLRSMSFISSTILSRLNLRDALYFVLLIELINFASTTFIKAEYVHTAINLATFFGPAKRLEEEIWG